MCGVSGFFNIALDIKKEILQNLEIRGRDGFGFLAWNASTSKNPGQWIQKSLLPPTDFLSQNGSRFDVTLSSDIVIGNTRAIPTTEFQSGAGSDLKNQQPFTKGRYSLVFNGLISNDKELIQKYNLQTDAPVDTAMLAPLFNHLGVIEGMKQLDGSFAIIVFDKIDQKFYFGKNFMPMFYSTTKNSALAVSLKEMAPDSIVGQLKEVPPYSCIVYDTTDGTETIESLYRKERNKKAMIIASGGTDSVVTAYVYKRLGYDITLAHFTYGQAAEEVEKFAIEQIAKHLNAKLVVYDARPLFSAFKDASKLLSQKEADPNQQMLDAESTLSYVPNRNAIFAMIIAALAEKENCGTVAFGGQQMDSVSGDTPFLIRDENGNLFYKTIKEIEHFPFAKWFIQSFNKNTYKIEEQQITKVWKHKVNRQMFEIETKLGDKIKITEDHGIFVINQKTGEIYCKDGRDVVVDDYLILNKNSSFNIRPIISKTVEIIYRKKKESITIPLTQTVLEFLGLWLAEGSHPSSYEICTSIAKKEFNKEWWDKLQTELNFAAYRLRDVFGTSYDVLIGNAKLQRAMKVLGFVGKSHEKKIPDWVYNLNREQIGFLLKGYFSGDGCISYQGTESRSLVIDASSTSFELISGVRNLLLQLGIVSQVKEQQPVTFVQNNKTYTGRKSWEVYIRGVEFVQRYAKYVRFLYVEKQQRLAEIFSYTKQDHFAQIPIAQGVLEFAQTHTGTFKKLPYLTNMYTQKGISRNDLLDIAQLSQNQIWEHLAESDVYFVPIKQIIEIPSEEFVYDFSVANNENFFDAKGILYHNSVYPDNTPDFVRTIDATLKYSLNWQTNVKFAAPLIHLIKHEIVLLGLNLQVPFDYVCSCYYPKLVDNKIVVCGKCGCCQFRFSSFKMLGFKDTQAYATLPDPKWFDGLKDWAGGTTMNVDVFLNRYVRNFA